MGIVLRNKSSEAFKYLSSKFYSLIIDFTF